MPQNSKAKPGSVKKKSAEKTSRAPVAPRRPRRVSVLLDRAIVTTLGDDPAAAIDELLQLRAFFEAQSLQTIKTNPFLNTRPLDTQRSLTPFAHSDVVELRNWRGTEREIVDEALRISSLPVGELGLRGLLRESATIIQGNFLRTTRPSAPGVRGSRFEPQLEAAAAALRDNALPVTASALRTRTGVTFRTCQRFLDDRGPALGLFKQTDGRTWLPYAGDGGKK